MVVKDFVHTIKKSVKPSCENSCVTKLDVPGSYYTDIKPILYTLRALARLPVYITDKGLEKCPLISWPWIYSVIGLSIQIIMTLITLYHVGDSMNSSKVYDEYLFWLMLSMVLTHNLMVPVTYWIDTSNLIDYLTLWSQFQNKYFTATKTWPYKLEFLEEDLKFSRNYVYWLSLVNFPLVLSFTLVEHLFSADMPLIAFYPFVSLFSAIYSSSLLWTFSCRLISRIANILLEKTKMAIKKDKTQELTWCRQCWIHLSALTAGLGQSSKNAALFSTIIMSVCFVIAIYACMSIFTKTISVDHIIGTAVQIPVTLTIILLIFNHANTVTAKVGTEFCCEILSLDLSHLSDSSNTEVNVFLQSLVLSPPTVRLADFVTVDRRLITSFTSNVITYLIVLLQFRQSGYEKEPINESYHNSTS